MWYVHCNHYTEMRFEARDEAAAEHKLENEMNWRLSMKGRPRKIRFWACPACAERYEDAKETTMATAESASQLAHAAVVDDLKAEVVELKAEECPRACRGETR